MKRLSWLTLCLLFALSACPKEVPTNVAGTDDEQMDRLSAQLEELRTREVTCPTWCDLKGKVCGLSQSVCEVSARQSERQDFQRKCITGQEDCARFNDGCSTCR